jgi:predicted lipid-binding transport protein (Tim44 family)
VNGLPTRIAIAAACGVVALIVFGTTLWFLGDALMLLLEADGFMAAAAAGLTGLAGLVLAALIGLTAKAAMRPPRRQAVPATAPRPGGNGAANGIVADLGALAAQQIINTTRAHPYSTMGAALAAGLAVGAIPELRKTLTGLLKH